MYFIILASALYLIVISMMMKTENFRSFLFFRLLPFLLGLVLLAHSVKGLGWLSFL